MPGDATRPQNRDDHRPLRRPRFLHLVGRARMTNFGGGGARVEVDWS
jgi:hypothetical protein